MYITFFYYAFLLTDDQPKNVPITETYSDLTTTSKSSERDEFTTVLTTYTDTALYTNKESTTTTLHSNLDNTESTTENRPMIMTATDISTVEQLKTTKQSAIVHTTTQSNVDVTSAEEFTHTFTDTNDVTLPSSTVAENGIEARTESDDNIITEKGPINLEPTLFTNAPRTTGTTIPGTNTETILTILTSGTTSYTTKALPTETMKATTESKDLNETTTNEPFTAINYGTEFITQNTISYTDIGSKNYSTTLDSDELVQSSSTMHIESTEKPYIKRNESEPSTPSTENKNTKNPENQRQLNNNYTETTQATKLNTFSLHTSSEIDATTTTTSSNLYTTDAALTKETTQVIALQFSTITAKNETDAETVIGETTDNFVESTQNSESTTTEIVTANNYNVMSSTESQTALTESISISLQSTIVHELSTAISTESNKISTLQSEQSTDTITDNTPIQPDTGTKTDTIANQQVDQILVSQNNSSPVSTASTAKVTETEQTELFTVFTIDFKDNESTIIIDTKTDKEPEVTTQLHKNDKTDYTTESTSFTHENSIDTTSEFREITTTDTSTRTSTNAQHFTKPSIQHVSDTVTTDSETVTNPMLLSEVTSKTTIDHVVPTSIDIKLETSTPLMSTTQMEMSNTITDTSHEISTKIFKDDIATNTLLDKDQTVALNSMVTTEYFIEARTKISTNDDTTSSMRDIIVMESTSSTINLEKTTETRKNIVTTTNNSESLKKVTEFPYFGADNTEKEIANQQSSTLWEDIETSSQKTTLQTHVSDYSTQHDKETTRNIKETMPTIQSQFSTHLVNDDNTVTMSSRPKTTETILDSSTSNSFTYTVLNEAITTTSTSYTKHSQEDITKPYEISTPIVIEATARDYTDKSTEKAITSMKEEVASTITEDDFAQSTSQTTEHMDITSNNDSFDEIDKMFTQETSQTTQKVLEVTSTTSYKSIHVADSTSETITTQSPELDHYTTTESNEVSTADISTSNIIITESYPTNTVIVVTSQSIDNQNTTLKQNENTEGVNAVATSTINSQSHSINMHADTTSEPKVGTRVSIESTTEQFSGSVPSKQETDTHTTTVKINNNMPYDMDYTGTQFESTVDNVVIMTTSTSATNIYNANITEVTTNIQETTSETEIFTTTTESESSSEVTFTPSAYTTKSYNTSITEVSTNTEETTSETEMFITSTQSTSKPLATSTVQYSPVTSIPTIVHIYDKTATATPVTENIEKSPNASTSTENMSPRQRENIDISAWTDSTFTTDLTSTESSVQTTETVTNVKQCEVNSQCSVDKACLNGVCQNPCETARSLCTKSVACKVVNHTAVCVCDDAAGVYCVRGMHFLFAYHN